MPNSLHLLKQKFDTLIIAICDKYCSKIKILNWYNNSLSIKSKNLRWDMWCKIVNSIKNLISFSFCFRYICQRFATQLLFENLVMTSVKDELPLNCRFLYSDMSFGNGPNPPKAPNSHPRDSGVLLCCHQCLILLQEAKSPTQNFFWMGLGFFKVVFVPCVLDWCALIIA